MDGYGTDPEAPQTTGDVTTPVTAPETADESVENAVGRNIEDVSGNAQDLEAEQTSSGTDDKWSGHSNR